MFELMKRVAGELLVLLVVLHAVYNLMNFLSALSFKARATLVSVLLIGIFLAISRLKG